MKKLSGLILFIVVCSLPLHAAEAVHYSLHETIAAIDTNNPGIKSISHSVNAAEKGYQEAVRSRFGKVTGIWNYSRLDENQILVPMTRELLADGLSNVPFDKNQVHYGLQFELPLYQGGKLNQSIKLAQLKQDSQRQLLVGSRWQVRFNVTSLYSSAQMLDEVVATLNEQIQVLSKTKERLELMVNEGKRPDIDRLKVVEELQTKEAELALKKADRRKVGAMLLAMVGRNPADNFEVDPFPEKLPTCQKQPVELHLLLEQSSIVQRKQAALAQSESMIKVVRSEFIPHIQMGGNYMWNDAPSSDDPLETWQFSIGVSIPIFSGGKRFAQYDAAVENRKSVEQALIQTELQVSASLEEALAKFKAAQASLSAARARLDAAAEAARIEQVRFDTGAGTIEDLLRIRSREQGAKAGLAQAISTIVVTGEQINCLVEQEVVR